MKEYTKNRESQSRTVESNSNGFRQPPVSEILQAYRNGTLGRSPVQRESIEEDDDLTSGQSPVSTILQQYSEKRQKYASKEDEGILQGKFDTAQRQEKPNNTGLPDNLKSGIENLSGYSMDDVKVHYNSDKPAQLNALAYAQGTDIHVASGQEKHLPHEAWHVVQQKQGRVQSAMQMQGMNVNTNEELEREADSMGIECLNYSSEKIDGNFMNLHSLTSPNDVIQLFGGSFLDSIRHESYVKTTQKDRGNIIYFMDYIKSAYNEAHKRISTYQPSDNFLLKETPRGILFLEIFSENLVSRFDEFEYDENEDFFTLIQPFINEVSNLPEKLVFAIDEGKGTMADLFEILALGAYIGEECLMRSAERGGYADFKIGEDYYDPFMTPIKLQSSAVTTWNKFFTNRANTFDQHAGGKGCNAKAILDLTFTPYYDLVLLRNSFEKDMETTQKDEILKLANVYVVYYGESFLTRESIILMKEIKLMFDRFREKNELVLEEEAREQEWVGDEDLFSIFEIL